MEQILGLFTMFMNYIGKMVGLDLTDTYNKENIGLTAKTNYMYNEMSADNAQKRQMELYNSLYSPVAQMDMIQNAGLSPGLFYTGAGSNVGNAYGPQGAGASGQHAMQPQAVDLFDINGAMAASKVQSEIDLNNAMAHKAEEEANVVAPEAEAKIVNLYADTGLKNAQEAGQKVENNILELESYIKDMTAEAEIGIAFDKWNNIREENKLIAEEAEQAYLKNKLVKDTYNQLVEEQTLKNANLAQDILNKKFNIYIEKEKLKAFYQQLNIEAERNDIMSRTQQAQQDWYQDQIKLHYDELGLQKDIFEFNKTYGPAKDIIQTLAYGGMAAGALMFKGAGAFIAAGRTLSNTRKLIGFK